MLALGLLVGPVAFASLARAEAGRLMGQLLGHEAQASLAFGVVVLLLERAAARRRARAGQGSHFSATMILALGAVFCTVAGHFALLPMMAAARAGSGSLSFAALHTVSVAFFGLKAVLVGAIAWRATGALSAPGSS